MSKRFLVSSTCLITAYLSSTTYLHSFGWDWWSPQKETTPSTSNLEADEIAAMSNLAENTTTSETKETKYTKPKRDFLIEAKAAYFRPSSDKFRKIYGGGGIYGLELSDQAWKDLYVWASGSYFDRSGHSQACSKNSTRVYFIPLGLGLKYFWKTKHLDLYLGAGMLATYLHIRNDSPYVIRKESHWGFGGIFKGGALINLTKSVFIDLFSDYSLMTVHFHGTNHGKIVRHNAHLDGWSIGGGLGYRF